MLVSRDGEVGKLGRCMLGTPAVCVRLILRLVKIERTVMNLSTLRIRAVALPTTPIKAS